MRIGTMNVAAESAASTKTARKINTGYPKAGYSQSVSGNSAAVAGGRLREMLAKDSEDEESTEPAENVTMAEKVYQAAVSGKRNPLEELRQKPKVPYEHLAKDGVIEYNGVVFVCDYEKNCICLGDMSDESNVLTIPLSGGGSLRVNRDNIGELSKAADMFSPEDLKLIMRAIAQDNKVHSMKEEIEDMEANVGNELQGGSQTEDES